MEFEPPLRCGRTPVGEIETRHSLAQQSLDDAVAWCEVGDAAAVQRIGRNDQDGRAVGILAAHGKIQQTQRREFAKHAMPRRPFRAFNGTARLAAGMGVNDRREGVDRASTDGQLQVQNVEQGIEGRPALHFRFRSGPDGPAINCESNLRLLLGWRPRHDADQNSSARSVPSAGILRHVISPRKPPRPLTRFAPPPAKRAF